MESKTTTFQLYSRVDRLEEEIKPTSSGLNQTKYQALFRKLDSTLSALDRAPFPDLKERVVALYGKLEDNLAQSKLSEIEQTAQRLESLVIRFEESHLPSCDDRQKLAKAKQALAAAQVEKKSQEPIDAELVYEVLDVARALHEGEVGKAKKLFNQLPQSLQEQCKERLNDLIAKAFESKLETIQALIATANALAHNGSSYPSQAEIDTLFLFPQETSKIVHVDFN